MTAPLDTSSAVWEAYAIKYAEADGLSGARIEVGSDLHSSRFAMAYYLWLLRTQNSCIVVDCGFNESSGALRGRRFTTPPEVGLAKLGVNVAEVKTLICTHLHYDHVGNADLFPNAVFHVQDAEVSFATGRQMCHHFFRDMYQVEDITAFVGLIYAGRVLFHDGDAYIAPGVSVHRASGHTPGVQFVRVQTRSGWLVLASDACHFNFLRREEGVYPVVFDPAGLIAGYGRLRELASSDSLVIPGHDPEVMHRYPAANDDLPICAVRLD